MIITTKFNIADKVIINEINFPGMITEIKFDGYSVIYCIEYWLNGEIRTVNLYESELSPLKEKK